MPKAVGRARQVRAPRAEEGDVATRRPNRVLLLVLAAIAVISLVAGGLAASRHGPVYDSATPEGVVQAYLSAVIDGDHDGAARFLAAESPCSVADLDRAYLPQGVRVALRETQVTADTARVAVSVATPSGDPFGSENFEKHTFRLIRSGGTWLVLGEPWPMSDCGRSA
jgi:hypothetical protein